MDALPDERNHRFVAILNRKIETGKLLNALGHMTAGLAGGAARDLDLHLLQYVDGDGGTHPYISHFPFIVLQADNGNQIRTVRGEAIMQGIPCTDFVSSMTVGTSAEQLERTKATPEADLEYFGICLFGETEALRQLTKKFSLFR